MNIPKQPPQGEVVGSVAKMLARAGPILKRLPNGPHRPVMVEVGVSSGIMAEYLLRSHPSLEWHGVDPWASPEQQRQCYIESGDVHAVIPAQQTEFCREIALRRLQPFELRAHVYREWSPEAAEGFASGSVDCVFLDGDHSLEGTLADCRAWWRVVKPGGWLGGHDLSNRDPRFRFGVDEAVAIFAGEVDVPFEADGGLTWWICKP